MPKKYDGIVEITKLFQKSERFLVDILFPRCCVKCGKEGSFVCDLCKKSLEYLSFQICPVCEKTITLSGEQCLKCRQAHTVKLDRLIAAGSYSNRFLARLIHTYKYKFVEELSEDLGDFMANTLQKWKIPTPDIIVPVPLHKRRLKWRGFNQSLLLAEYISENLTPGIEIPVDNETLERKRHTMPQMEMKEYDSRKQNMQNAFAVKPSAVEFRNKNILLVDDICTTGATLFECARAISTLRPRSITAIVLARQDM